MKGRHKVNERNNGLWDEHAQWWIDGFTNGVDPEYEEQIIPLALEELHGKKVILDVGCSARVQCECVLVSQHVRQS